MFMSCSSARGRARGQRPRAESFELSEARELVATAERFVAEVEQLTA
jgi:hypothetical protein